MDEWEELGRFLVGLGGKITNNVTRGLKNVGKSFTNQLAGFINFHKFTRGIPDSGFI